MLSTNELGLSNDRVQSSSDVDLSDLQCSAICGEILWKPTSCEQCETHFCSTCIGKWFATHPNQCPLRCENYNQRPCSKFIARQLAKLQISCIYQSNGCNEILPYEALEKHETQCDYQLIQCSDCSLEILKRNFDDHRFQCSLIQSSSEASSTCPKPVESSSSQVGMIRSNEETERMQNHLFAALISSGLIADTTPGRVKREHLPSTVEIDCLDKNRLLSKGRSTESILCSKCGHVVWKPVSCKICQTVFCHKCCPWSGVIGSLMTFFSSTKTHGRNHCDKFVEAPIPERIAKDLSATQIRCCYASNGCSRVCLYDDLIAHEQRCDFEAVPCSLCQYPISKRRPIGEHTTRACFEQMQKKNPSAIQQQFMILLKAMEQSKEEHARLRSSIDQLRTDLKTLDADV